MNTNQIAIPQLNSGLTKTSIKTLAVQFTENILENGGAMEAAEALSAVENFVKEVKTSDKLKDAIRSEIELNGKSYTLPSGAKLELAETGSKYDFSQCNDADLVYMEQRMADLEEQLKQRKDMLKNLPLQGIDMAMQTTGEVVTIYPPSKTSTSSYKVTLCK